MSQQLFRLDGSSLMGEVVEAVDRLENDFPEAVEIVDTFRNIIRDHLKRYDT